jgi:hypothetical protein
MCAAEGCRFILDGPGGKAVACEVPVKAGSSYCATHHAVCYLRPESESAASALQEIEEIAAAVGGRCSVGRAPAAKFLSRLTEITAQAIRRRAVDRS